MKALIALGGICLSACTLPSSPGDPVTHQVSVDGQPYQLSQLTAGTWIATASGVARPLESSLSSRAALLEAIEKTSGCQATDSDYSRQGRQLDAQVDCGSKLNN
jgi:hypothetical protein